MTEMSYREAIVAAGGIPPLLDLLRTGSDDAKFQAVGALDNLSSGDCADITDAIAEGGGIPLTITLIQDGINAVDDVFELKKKTADLATGLLYNLSVNYNNKKLIAAEGGIQVLIDYTRYYFATDPDGGAVAVLNYCAGALWNLAELEQNHQTIVDAGGIPVLVEVVRGTFDDDDETKTFAAAALRCLSV